MKSKISFRALRAFEASVRLGSLSEAARNLNVTPGAVSRQINALEADLAQPLVSRDRNGARAIGKGVALAEELNSAFLAIDRALDRAKGTERGRAVTLQTWPTFAIQWLMPRLASFHAQNADIDLRIQTSLAIPDFTGSELDMAVLIAESLPEGLDGVLLFTRDYAPVCSPTLLERNPDNDPISLFETERALMTEMHAANWKNWCRAAGLSSRYEDRAIVFESSSLAWQAARDGAGFAMGQLALLGPDLERGTLVTPFRATISDPRSYWLAFRKEAHDWAELKRVVNWFKSQLNGEAESRDSDNA